MEAFMHAMVVCVFGLLPFEEGLDRRRAGWTERERRQCENETRGRLEEGDRVIFFVEFGVSASRSSCQAFLSIAALAFAFRCHQFPSSPGTLRGAEPFFSPSPVQVLLGTTCSLETGNSSVDPHRSRPVHETILFEVDAHGLAARSDR